MYMTYRERIVLETLVKRKTSVIEMSKHLGRCRQTIYNELRVGRVLLKDSLLRDYVSYSADVAQQRHEFAQTAKGRPLKIGHDHVFASYIEHKIVDEHYSPSAALAAASRSGKMKTSVCPATLYNYVRAGVIGVDVGQLPRGRQVRKAKDVLLPPKVLAAPSIEQRPQVVNSREELGHWEMDCVCSKQGVKAALLVLTERKSRYELIFKMVDKQMKSVVAILDRLERRLSSRFSEVFKSLTVDNGSEFRDYDGMKTGLDGSQRTEIYYCHPYRSGERGTNENSNGIIRRWFPKGTDFTDVSDQDILKVQNWMNHYPRKILDWKCPADFDVFLAELDE